jgi:thiamine biosynthesis protein ThiS
VKIVINGQPQEVSDHLTLSQLIDILSVPQRYVAAEVNCQLVPRSRHDEFQLADGDCVEIVTLVGGG